MFVYKSVEVNYDYKFQETLNNFAKEGWRVVSVFRPDNMPDYYMSVVVVLEKKEN